MAEHVHCGHLSLNGWVAQERWVLSKRGTFCCCLCGEFEEFYFTEERVPLRGHGPHYTEKRVTFAFPGDWKNGGEA